MVSHHIDCFLIVRLVLCFCHEGLVKTIFSSNVDCLKGLNHNLKFLYLTTKPIKNPSTRLTVPTVWRVAFCASNQLIGRHTMNALTVHPDHHKLTNAAHFSPGKKKELADVPLTGNPQRCASPILVQRLPEESEQTLIFPVCSACHI